MRRYKLNSPHTTITIAHFIHTVARTAYFRHQQVRRAIAWAKKITIYFKIISSNSRLLPVLYSAPLQFYIPLFLPRAPYQVTQPGTSSANKCTRRKAFFFCENRTGSRCGQTLREYNLLLITNLRYLKMTRRRQIATRRSRKLSKKINNRTYPREWTRCKAVGLF